MDDILTALGQLLKVLGRIGSNSWFELTEVAMRGTGERYLRMRGKLPEDPVDRENESWKSVGIGCLIWLTLGLFCVGAVAVFTFAPRVFVW